MHGMVSLWILTDAVNDWFKSQLIINLIISNLNNEILFVTHKIQTKQAWYNY